MKLKNKFINIKRSFVAFLMIFALLMPSAPAQAAGLLTFSPVELAQAIIKFVNDNYKDVLREAALDAAAAFWNNGVQRFVNQLAQETAVWVASGDEGQKPLLFTQNWGDYLATAVADATASTAIAFADAAGVGDICVSPQVVLEIILPQLDINIGGKPRCSLDDLKSTWDVTDPAFLENISLSFRTNQNDLGIAVNFLADLNAQQAKEKEAAENERDGSFFKSVKDGISEFTKTPAPLVEKKVTKIDEDTTKTSLEFTGRPVADAIRVFAGTLAGQYLQKLKSGFFSLADVFDASDPRLTALQSINSDLGTGTPGGLSADNRFAKLLTPDIVQVSSFDAISELSLCPTEVKYAGIYNCAIDTSFVQALQGGTNGYYTVQEAVNAGYLHGSWSFGYLDPTTGIEPSYLNGYAYSNMKKLRQLRILPVGWEMAAARARELGIHITLQDVLDDYDGTDGAASPFYRLVDPQWVLKIPEMRCTAKVPGQLFLVGSSDRLSTCVDVQDCITFGADGACLSWGYCTHDKKTWDFPGDQCDEVYATCDQYFEQGQGASDNYWLGSTLTYEACNADTAGCSWYSLVRNSANEWNPDNRIYLTDKKKECDAEDAGCSEYISMGNGSNLLRNSSFEDDSGHNYELGLGDQIEDNSIPDGWQARQALVTMTDTETQNGSTSVLLSALAGSNCLPGLQYQAPIGSYEVAQRYTLSGMIRTDVANGRDFQLAFENLRFTIEDVSDGWKAFAFSFIMPATQSSYTLVLGANAGNCADLNINGKVFYDSLQLERGEFSTNYKEYGSINKVYLQNAPACTFEEVGCQVYEPSNSSTGSTVTGVVTGADLCPAECNEYFSYEQKETDLEPTRFSNFISSSINSCRAEEVGCEQFTNLDSVSQGGEGIEYYSQIRHCEKPQASCRTFFAWEGSDVTGFQLVNYSFSTDNGVPRTTDGSDSCDPEDPNCSELIGEDGTRYFRDLTKTITCSENCTPLRAQPGLVTQQECESKLGTFDTVTNRCVFNAITEESTVCREQVVGCREYVGNTGYNVKNVYSDDFEGASLQGWAGATLSTESTEVGGHSLKIGNTNNSIAETVFVELDEYEPGKNYTISFMAKSSVSDFLNVSVYFGDFFNEETRAGGIVTRNRNWNEYTVGPIQLSDDPVLPALGIDVRGATNANQVVSLFVDNIVIKEINTSVYGVKDSWETPASCDTNPPLSNGTASRSMVGCQEYRIQDNAVEQPIYLKSFSRLCSDDKVGCEALIDTKNSSAPYREIFQEGNEAEFVVPADDVTYLVNADEYKCNLSAKGCMEVGLPTFDQEQNILGFESRFIVNNPDLYDTIMCPGEAISCKAYRVSNGTTVYAKNPGLQQCEYRQVPNSFPPRFAWFKQGQTEENPTDCLNAEENSFVQRCNSQQVSCTEYYEPITDEAFYYKKNSLSNSIASCNGVVDWAKGCVLFNDLSDRDLTFKSGEEVDFVGSPDACQTNDLGCNTNTLLRVSLNRECSQWLAGNSLSRFWNEDLQSFRTTSYGLGRCLTYDSNNPQLCLEWDNETDKEILTIANYQSREIGWASDQETGYSIPGLYPVEIFRQRSVGFDEYGDPKNFRLTKISNPGSSCNNTSDCALGQVCRLDLDTTTGTYQGSCYVEEGLDGSGKIEAASCRAYPEVASPFPSSLATFAPLDDKKNPGQIISKQQQYTNANIGQLNENVECSYHKVRYQGTEVYYGLDTIPQSSIISDGAKADFSSKNTFIGWEGYCLERDTSRIINGSDDQFACLTWYPVDLIQGSYDINNSDENAGYQVAQDAQYYCAEAILAEYRTTWQFCSRATCGSGYDTTRAGSCSGHSHNRRECNPLGGDGWYPYDGDIKGNEELGIMCSKIARISDARGRTAAWTTRILGDILPGSQEYFVKDLGWGYDQINKPYGSARPIVTRLEDLTQPLVVLDPHTFVDDCEVCKIEEYPLSGYANTQKSPKPFGICEDEEPSKNGKPCPYRPNAGSPFALLSEVDPQLINDENVPIRRGNKLPSDEPQPYPGSEDYTKGFDRLQLLFAKSYGVWEWQSLPSICVGQCSGGVSDGEYCASDSVCGQPEDDLSYTCAPNVCSDGYRNGLSCVDNSDCMYASTGTIHQCVQDQSPAGGNNFVCESGPYIGENCTSLSDCSEASANGICGTTTNHCQATDADGNIMVGDNSGKQCNSSSECNSAGSCTVQSCSTDPAGTNSGLCSEKKAGESCGANSTVNQYTRIPFGQPAFGWDLVSSNPQESVPPTIRPVVSSTSSPSGFAEGFAPDITVTGAITGLDGRAPVGVQFYAYNDNGEQMPLRLILVDWGDGTDATESRGSFKNHKNSCRNFCSNAVGRACSLDEDCQDQSNPDAQCLPFNFGDTSEACIDDSEGANGFFAFNHTYTYDASCPVKTAGGACVFKPSVLVKDNWGATSTVSYSGQITVAPPNQPTP